MPYLVVAGATLSASAAAILFRLATAAPITVAFYRLGFSALLLVGPLWLHRQERVSRRDLVLTAVSGLFLAAHFAFWFSSLTLTSIASSTVLVCTHPFLILGYEYVSERFRPGVTAAVGAGISVAGAVMVGWGDFHLDSRALLGDLLAFLGAAAFAGYLLIGRSVRKRLGAIAYSFHTYLAASALLGLLALLTGSPLTGFPAQNWMVFGALALIPTIFGHTLFNWALRYLPASVVSVNVLGEPIGATLLAWLLWREWPGRLTIGGGVLILIGIGLFLRYHHRSGT